MMTRITSSSDEDRAEAAVYIASLSGDLALMARRYGLNTLGYLLDMAKLEAESVTRRDRSEGRPP
jgi:hypothetical protein